MLISGLDLKPIALLILLVAGWLPCSSQIDRILTLSPRSEPGVSSEIVEEDNITYLLIESEPSQSGPSVYFGLANVIPGKTYTYAIKGTKRSTCRIFQYVITPHGNLVWPGSEFENGFASTSFKIPSGVNSVTIGLTFLNPSAQSEAVLIQDILLYEGEGQILDDRNLNLLALGEPLRYNLFDAQNLAIKCESGVIAKPTVYKDAEVLEVSSAPSKRGPSIYFGNVNVKAGNQYTYFVKGKKRASCRVLLYVTSEKANVVWPGPDLLDGEVGVTFNVPDSVSVISLGLTFLYPESEGESALIEDISLFAGNVKVNEQRQNSISLSRPFDNTKPWAYWVLALSFFVVITTSILQSKWQRKNYP